MIQQHDRAISERLRLHNGALELVRAIDKLLSRPPAMLQELALVFLGEIIITVRHNYCRVTSVRNIRKRKAAENRCGQDLWGFFCFATFANKLLHRLIIGTLAQGLRKQWNAAPGHDRGTPSQNGIEHNRSDLLRNLVVIHVWVGFVAD